MLEDASKPLLDVHGVTLQYKTRDHLSLGIATRITGL